MSLLHIFEQCLSSTQDKGIDHQSQFIDQAQIHQTGYQSGAAKGQHVLARLLLHLSDFFYVPNDPCRLPCHFVQSLGKDDMGYLIGSARISVFILRPGRLGQEGKPVLLVGRIHPPPQYKVSTDLSVSSRSLHVSSSSAIAQSSSPLGPSMKPSTDVCNAAIIFS